MPERSHEGRILRRATAVSLALAATGAAIRYAPDLIEELTTEPSLIVAGVPGQIETWESNRSWNGRYYVTTRWLGIEQCPTDIEAAKRGETAHSFDPKVGVRNPACSFDWVKVGADTFSSVAIGSSIIFEGQVGEPLKK